MSRSTRNEYWETGDKEGTVAGIRDTDLEVYIPSSGWWIWNYAPIVNLIGFVEYRWQAMVFE